MINIVLIKCCLGAMITSKTGLLHVVHIIVKHNCSTVLSQLQYFADDERFEIG